MDVGVMKDYLVKLGFGINQQELTKFQNTLENVGKQVEAHTTGLASAFAGMATTITAADAAIGAATVALADKVSQAELGYQLFSMKMYVTADAGKKLSIAMDALGHSLDEIAWNKELQDRFHQLIEDQTKLEGGLGPDYQQRMRELRDFRFEFTRVQVALQYMGMSLVNNLVKAFGIDDGKLKGWVNWFIENVPILAQKIANFLVPILKDTWSIFKDLWDIGSSLLSLFPAVWEALGGDPDGRIKQQRTEIEKIAVSFQEISHAIANVVSWIDRMKDALGIGATMYGGARLGALIGSLFGPEGTLLGGTVGAAAGALFYPNVKEALTSTNSGSASTDAADRARGLAKQVSSQTGIPADWIFAQWAHETDFFRSRAFREQNNLAGMREGMSYRTFGNMNESAEYFARLLMSPRYSSARGANSMEGYAYGLKQGGYYEDSYANYSRGLARWEPQYSRGDVHVGGVQVYVTHPAQALMTFTEQSCVGSMIVSARVLSGSWLEAGGPYR